jgi:hypothetical protein
MQIATLPWTNTLRRPEAGEAAATQATRLTTEEAAERLAAALSARGMNVTGEGLLAAELAQSRALTPLFRPDGYLAHLPPALRRTTRPLHHYLRTGAWLPLSTHPCIDPAFIAARHDAEDAPAKPGAAPGIKVPALLRLLEATEAPHVDPCPLFDSAFYAQHLPAAALDRITPFEHFLLHWCDNPVPFSRFFDFEFYFFLNQHVARARLNPLVHYFEQPVEQRTDANPMIHGRYYAASVGGVRGDPLAHYVRFGLAQGIAPNPYAFGELRVDGADLPPEVMRELLTSYVAAG